MKKNAKMVTNWYLLLIGYAQMHKKGVHAQNMSKNLCMHKIFVHLCMFLRN